MTLELRRVQRRLLKNELQLFEQFQDHVQAEFNLLTVTFDTTEPDPQDNSDNIPGWLDQLATTPQDVTQQSSDNDSLVDDSDTVVGDYHHDIERKHMREGDDSTPMLVSDSDSQSLSDSEGSLDENVDEQISFERLSLPKRRKSSHLPTYHFETTDCQLDQSIMIENMAVDPQLLMADGASSAFHITEVQPDHTPVTGIRHLDVTKSGPGIHSSVVELGSAEAHPLPADYENEDPYLMDETAPEEEDSEFIEGDPDLVEEELLEEPELVEEVEKDIKCAIAQTNDFKLAREFISAEAMSRPLASALLKFLEVHKLDRMEKHRAVEKEIDTRRMEDNAKKQSIVEAEVQSLRAKIKEMDKGNNKKDGKTFNTTPILRGSAEVYFLATPPQVPMFPFPGDTINVLTTGLEDTSPSKADSTRASLLAHIRSEIEGDPRAHMDSLCQQKIALLHTLRELEHSMARFKRATGHKKSVQRRYDRIKMRVSERPLATDEEQWGIANALGVWNREVRGRTQVAGSAGQPKGYGLGANATPLSRGKRSPLRQELRLEDLD